MPLGSPQSRRWVADHAPLTPAAAMLPPGPDPPPWWASYWSYKLVNIQLDGTWVVYPLAQFGLAGDDAATINQALIQANGQPVILGAFVYSLLTPIVLPVSSSQLEGTIGGQPSTDSLGSGLGTTLAVQSGFTNPQFGGVATAAILAVELGANSPLKGCRIRNLFMDLSAAPALVDGIAGSGAVNDLGIEHVGMEKPTGNGVASYQNVGSGNQPDGWLMTRTVVHQPVGDGFHGVFTDGAASQVHVQGATGSGLYNTGGGSKWEDGCRFEFCANGITIDNSGSSGNVSATILDGVQTSRNVNSGLNVINSDPTGTAWRNPVIATGCHFTQDGSSGSGQAVYVAGVNQVHLTGCQVSVGTKDIGSGNPLYALTTALAGSGNGAPVVSWTGGIHNFGTGGLAVHDLTNGAAWIRVSNTIPIVGFRPSINNYPAAQIGPAELPQDNNMVAVAFDVNAAQNPVALTAGTVYLMKLPIREPVTIAQLWFLVGTTGSGASSGTFAGLYTPAGTLLTGSSDIGTAFTASTGPKSVALTSPQNLSPDIGYVWAAVVVNYATTQPQLRCGLQDSHAADVGISSASNFRFAVNGTGRTTLAASITPSANSFTNAQTVWVGGN